MIEKVKNNNYYQNGFALLYAILLSGAVLTVGVILMNIITKQLVYSSVNRNSELAYYYAANSGRECLDYFANQNSSNFYRRRPGGGYNFKSGVSLTCLAQSLPIQFSGPNPDSSIPSNPDLKIYTATDIIFDNSIVTLTVIFNQRCLDDPSVCDAETELTKRYGAVMIADGSSSGGRIAKRTAIAVKK